MSSAKPIATYAGDTFKNLMRKYSTHRMETDPSYKQAVDAAMNERKRQANKPVTK